MKKIIVTIFISLTLVLGLWAMSPEDSLGSDDFQTTFEMELGGDKIYVGGIGDVSLGASKTVRAFKPEVTLTRWNNEESINVLVEDEVKERPLQIGDKVISESKDGKREYHFYTKTAEELNNEEGGFEYELILKEKPNTNVFEWKIEGWEDLRFEYQGTVQEDYRQYDKSLDCPTETTCYNKDKLQIVDRPENIVGSYAVYHKTKKDNQYKTGKLYHIYRPLIVDANGNKIWGELNFNQGVLTVTVEQNWLSEATYPVSVDPTFGKTAIGGTGYSWTDAKDDLYVLRATPSSSGTVDSIDAYVQRFVQNTNIKAVIVETSGLTILTNGVGGSLASNSTAQWHTLTYSASPSITSGTEYGVGIVVGTNNFIKIYEDSVSNAGYRDTTNNYTTPTDPTDASLISREWSFYATYTEAASEYMGTGDIIINNVYQIK